MRERERDVEFANEPSFYNGLEYDLWSNKNSLTVLFTWSKVMDLKLELEERNKPASKLNKKWRCGRKSRGRQGKGKDNLRIIGWDGYKDKEKWK